jgi:hypothetical protein
MSLKSEEQQKQRDKGKNRWKRLLTPNTLKQAFKIARWVYILVEIFFE